MWKSVNIISLTRQLTTNTYEYRFRCLVILIKSKFTVNVNLLHLLHNQQHIYYRDADCSKWEVRMQSSFLHGSQNSLFLAVCVWMWTPLVNKSTTSSDANRIIANPTTVWIAYFAVFFFSLESTWRRSFYIEPKSESQKRAREGVITSHSNTMYPSSIEISCCLLCMQTATLKWLSNGN